jgi:hypothetical protein
MTKQLLAAVAALGILGLTASPAVAIPKSPPKGQANGYWAQRLCDHVGSTTGGMTYWESRSYASRDACVDAEAASLARGEWSPADWPEI